MDIRRQDSIDPTNVQDDINIAVQTPSKLVLVNLNLKASLSEIRENLEKNSEVKMNDTFLFTKMIKNNNSTGGSLLAIIAREDEEMIILENIIGINNYNIFLYLKSETVLPDWKFLNDKLKLEYGRTETLEKANNKAFTIVDCEMNEIVDGYNKSTIQIDLEEDKIISHDLLLTADINISNFTKSGVSIENSIIKNFNVITNSTYSVIEYNKITLKFKLEPTIEFIEAVKAVIDSKDPRKFKDVIDEFGKFIPKEIILGGRAYIIAGENSEENSDGNFTNIGEVCSENFNEADWVESLRDFRNWSCIKFKDPVNIFQLLPENLRSQVLLLIGKKILYTNTEDFTYYLFEPEMHHTFKLNIPENILKILQHKDADCSIFATAIDKKEKDIFNCQVVWPPNEDPKLIIHCIQKKIRKRKCKLKIRWMIIGYDINFDFNHSDLNVKLKILKNDFDSSDRQAIIKPLDLEYDSSALYFGIPVLNKSEPSNDSLVIGHHFFNDENKIIGSYIFSYCLKKNHFVNLPNFTFYTLIISNYPNSDNYGISPLQHASKISKLLNFIKFNSLKSNPKFISLYSTKNKYGPIFIKQKTSEIKIKHINVNCDQENCICKSKKLEDNLKYAFLDPKNPN
ncbi:unnamed protein product [Rhizophagus irregularis]|nr:unnamed protein product [Rhizophagus irregularis]